MKLSITVAENAAPLAPFVLRDNYSLAIEKAALLGYDAVELHVRNPEEIDAEALRESCFRHGIKVSSLGTGLAYAMEGLSLNSRDSETRKKAIERVDSHIRLADKLDCLVIIGLMKGQVKENCGFDFFESLLQDSLKHCLDVAAKEQVMVVLEVINRYESDSFNTTNSTAEFISRFDTNLLKMHIDTFHMNIEESDMVQPILQAKELIGPCAFCR
ncbi:TIM barrel protein [Ammoniphilus sp. 3BR4]|uniref:TIM barrel protein n=1 Tax=Ammoniphilus sp. 3BR4 TaxID=3158265 RepID=UPI0034669573